MIINGTISFNGFAAVPISVSGLTTASMIGGSIEPENIIVINNNNNATTNFMMSPVNECRNHDHNQASQYKYNHKVLCAYAHVKRRSDYI